MNSQYDPPQSHVEDVNSSSSAEMTSAMLEAMRGTKPWVLLIGILLLVFASFMVLGTFGMFFASSMGLATEGPGAGAMLGVGAMYGVMSIIYILLGVYLIKYSSAIGRLLQSTSVIDMEDALNSQRKFWKLVGILTVVMLVLMVLGFVAAMTIPFLNMTH